MEHRGPVPDPIIEEVDRLVRLIAGRVGQPEMATPRAAERMAELFQAISQQDAEAWDSDQDGTLTLAEIRRGLEIAYGVRHPSGSRLRRETGQVFDWRTFRSYDQDSDGILTAEEFTQRYWGGAEKGQEVFCGGGRGSGRAVDAR